MLKRLSVNILESSRLQSKELELKKQLEFSKCAHMICLYLLTMTPTALHTSLLRLNYEQSLPTKLLSVHFSSVKRLFPVKLEGTDTQ